MYQSVPITNGVHSKRSKKKIQSGSMDPPEKINAVLVSVVESDSMDACFTAFDKNGFVQLTYTYIYKYACVHTYYNLNYLLIC